jgi:hypothetical protein
MEEKEMKIENEMEKNIFNIKNPSQNRRFIIY